VRKTFGRNFEENDEEMAVKLTPKIRLCRRTSKPRWRRLLLQSEKCTENHFSWVGHQQYRIFNTDVSSPITFQIWKSIILYVRIFLF
jgi:hypothetical protein